VIDTLGLSDTNGTKQDDKNINKIIDAAILTGSLAAIVTIVNGTKARVMNSIKNTYFNQILQRQCLLNINSAFLLV
jgi:hypothetical protein